MHLVCKRCKHEWEYAGDKHRTSCPKCKTSITVKNPYVKEPETRTFYRPITITQNTHRLTLELLDSIKFSRAKSWAKTNGQDYIELKVNSEGVLSL